MYKVRLIKLYPLRAELIEALQILCIRLRQRASELLGVLFAGVGQQLEQGERADNDRLGHNAERLRL